MGSAGRTDRGTGGDLLLFLLAGWGGCLGGGLGSGSLRVRVGEAVGGFQVPDHLQVVLLNSASTSGGLRRSPRVNEAASPADNRAYWLSVMVVIGLGREVGAVV